MACTIGTETLAEGAYYCDANKNLFVCKNGSLVYVSSNCGGTSTTCVITSDTGTTGTVGIEKTFTSTCVGSAPGALTWYFGDGYTAIAASGTDVKHTYTADGYYNVYYSWAGGETANYRVYIAAEEEDDTQCVVTSDTGTTGVTGVSKSFTSTCTGKAPGILTWHFGDGGTATAASGSDVTHTYAVGGKYYVYYEWYGGYTAEYPVTITSEEEETQCVVTSDTGTTGTEGVSKSFTSTCTGKAPGVLTWHFGDGGTTIAASGSDVTHTYAAEGKYYVYYEWNGGYTAEYPVTVAASGGTGVCKAYGNCPEGTVDSPECCYSGTVTLFKCRKSTISDLYSWNNTGVSCASTGTCSFSIAAGTSYEVGKRITFIPTCTGAPKLSRWDFGDDSDYVSVYPGSSVSHTYTKPGTYEVTLSYGEGAASLKVTITKSGTETCATTCKLPMYCNADGECVPPVKTCDNTTCKPPNVCNANKDCVPPIIGGCDPVCISPKVCDATTKTCVIPDLTCASTCKLPNKCDAAGKCVPPVTEKCPGGCIAPLVCNPVTGKCITVADGCTPATCPAPNYCDENGCQTLKADTKCVGMNRGGQFDPMCALEPGNEMYLYGAVGAVVLLLLLSKRE